MNRPLLPLIIVTALVAVGGCGDGADDRPAATTPATSTPTATPSPAATPPETADGGIDPMTDASTEPVHVPATNKGTALLTDVRAARHEGFDRLVFEFRNELPGYDVRFVAGPVRQDGSGRRVRVSGHAVVRIRMENALDADLSQGSATLTYTGPQRFKPSTPQLAEVARVGGFEGVLTWAAGLQDRVDFRVTTLTAPSRLVVDFRNH